MYFKFCLPNFYQCGTKWRRFRTFREWPLNLVVLDKTANTHRQKTRSDKVLGFKLNALGVGIQARKNLQFVCHLFTLLKTWSLAVVRAARTLGDVRFP